MLFGAAAVGTTPATLITLDGNARCLDGSPAVYYVSKGAHSGTHKFYLYHQGGGWCQDQDECAERALTPLGSSLSYAPTTDLMTKQTHVFMSRNESLNWMHDWTLVYMPYCACMVVLLSFDSSHLTRVMKRSLEGVPWPPLDVLMFIPRFCTLLNVPYQVQRVAAAVAASAESDRFPYNLAAAAIVVAVSDAARRRSNRGSRASALAPLRLEDVVARTRVSHKSLRKLILRIDPVRRDPDARRGRR